jgi:hypothetical protein
VRDARAVILGGPVARRAVYPRRVRAGKKMNGDEGLDEGPSGTGLRAADQMFWPMVAPSSP